MDTYTLEEVAKHRKDGDLWVAINGKVYDISKFNEHPGGQSVLRDNAGSDASDVFENAGHDETNLAELNEKYLIGTIGGVKKRKAARIITMEELQKHDKRDDLWILIHGKVYDVSNFKHPGGKDILLDHSRRSISDEFDNIQHQMAHKFMPDLLIGEIEKAAP